MNQQEIIINKLESKANEYQKRNDIEFTENKKNINFALRGNNKYYYAFQCAKFEKNLIKYGFDTYATKSSIAQEGLYFNKYSITLGHYYGHDLKRFNSKEEMLGFVIGYNECISNLEYNSKLVEVA